MPKRQRNVRVPSPDIQGEDSWVEIRRMTVEEKEGFQQSARDVKEKHFDKVSEYAESVGKSMEDLDEVETAKALGDQGVDALLQFMNEALSAHVNGWNWVDDDDEPLPQPYQNPDIFSKLLQHEFRFLVQHVIFGDEDRKKKS